MREPDVRCPWSLKGNELYIDYHDTEWGVPAWDDRTQFEFLILEGAQAGLSWSTILNKREGYRAAFAGFDPERIARFGKRERGAADEGSGHRAQPAQDRGGDQQRARVPRFQTSTAASRSTCGRFVGGKPIQNRCDAAQAGAGDRAGIGRAEQGLKKRGFRFVGSTIIYAHMQATGMVNDHLDRLLPTQGVQGAGQEERRQLSATPAPASALHAAPPLPARAACSSRERVAHLVVELPGRVRDDEPRAVQPDRRVRGPHRQLQSQ